MNILVCVKQVSDNPEIKVNAETNALLLNDAPGVMNVFDSYALELAARIRDRQEAKIVALSVGTERSRGVLKECLSVGADKAYLVSDDAFLDSDTLATSYIISRAIRAIESSEGRFDMILCGRQAVDGNTAQVGAELAEHLGYPQTTCITDLSLEDGKAIVLRETGDGKERWQVFLPAVFTVTKTAFELRYASIKAKMAANRVQIPVLTLADLQAKTEKTGLQGSPVRIKRMFLPQTKRGGVVIREETAGEAAAKLLIKLMDDGILR